MECHGSLALDGQAEDSLIQMTVATSAEKLVTMPMTATGTAVREVADAAGLALGPDLGGDATLAVAATNGGTVPHPTPDERAGQCPRLVPGQEHQSGALDPQCAGPEAPLGGPERQSAGAVALVPAPAPDREHAVRPGPDPALDPAPTAAEETAVLGLPVQEPVQHLMLTDLKCRHHHPYPCSLSVSHSDPRGTFYFFPPSLRSGTVKSPLVVWNSAAALVSFKSFYFCLTDLPSPRFSV